MKIPTKIIAGKRKTAVAKVRVVSGKGLITFNKLPYTELNLFHKLALVEPIRIFEQAFGNVKYDFHIK